MLEAPVVDEVAETTNDLVEAPSDTSVEAPAETEVAPEVVADATTRA